MKEYPIKDIAEKLKITKATLRYYDRIELVMPSRKENDYRYYNDEDILDLQYIEVMKCAGYDLMEIKQVLDFKRQKNMENYQSLMKIIDDKKIELIRKIKLYNSMISFIDQAIKVVNSKNNIDDIKKVDDLIENMYITMIDGDCNE